MRAVVVVLVLYFAAAAAIKCHFKNDTRQPHDECEHFCFTLFSYPKDGRNYNESIELDNDDHLFIKQGCWEASPPKPCEVKDCIAQQKRKVTKNSTLFCCCRGDHCNGIVNIGEEEEEEDPSLPEAYGEEFHGEVSPLHHQPPLTIIFWLLGSVALLTLIAAGFGLLWRNRRLKPSVPSPSGDEEEAGELLATSDPALDLPISLYEELGRGKFATVWAGNLGGQSIALKIFPLENKEFFDNERCVYGALARVRSVGRNVLGYQGWEEVNGLPGLVLERLSFNLREFLMADGRKLTGSETLKVLRGIANGLSFLHGDNKDELVIAHRDLTSKNILIGDDLRVALSDFGLSVLTRGSRYSWAGHERQAECSSLAEAGTLRYMAPELLEGAVNLKDCENALKQADVYAGALVLWEVGCVGEEISLSPAYSLPYERELGKDITMEALSTRVVSHRERPGFYSWRDCQLSRSLRDTLSEAWDPEPEARLTALCIVQRLADLHEGVGVGGNSPLESLPASPWTGRNPCQQRNLLEPSEEQSEFLVESTKHRPPSESLSVSGAATVSTELSADYPQPHLHPAPPFTFTQNLLR